MLPMVEVAGLATAALMAAATVLPAWPTSRWWVRVLDFPRLQLVALGGLSLGLLAPSLVSGRSALAFAAAAIALLCILWHGWRIFPYLPLGRVQAPRA